MAVYHLPKDRFVKWLSGLDGRAVFAPSATALGSWVRRFETGDDEAPALDKSRAAQSAKGFFLPAAEAIARYGLDAPQRGRQTVAVAEAKTVIAGVRACELKAWKYLDKVMLEGEFDDPTYRARRENTTIISCDCVDCAETCCCVLVNGRPYVEEGDGADINITALEDGYVLEPLTDKGRELVQADWSDADGEKLAARENIRNSMVERLKAQNAEYTFSATDENPPILPMDDDESWQRYAADCVECGACTNICPTCHCFYLFDHELAAGSNERVRAWDSCLLSTYHRMAGGENMKMSPRPELRSRLANRILHKFVYSPQQYGMLGCVGCGRCVDACPGAIDIRKVVEDLAK